MVGAPPQPPRHSTVLDQVNSPSAVVSPDAMRAVLDSVSDSMRSSMQKDVEAGRENLTVGQLANFAAALGTGLELAFPRPTREPVRVPDALAS